MRFGVVISGKQKELITAGIKNDKSKPYLEGKEIDRYSINFKGNYLEYIPNKIHRPRTEDLFESKKNNDTTNYWRKPTIKSYI